MSARNKLNPIYMIIAAAIAGFVGSLANSALLFAITFALIAGAMLHDGTTRINTRK